jgi:hypothetical protein
LLEDWKLGSKYEEWIGHRTVSIRSRLRSRRDDAA